MAKKTQVLVTIVDDLDGTEVTEAEAQEVFFGYKGSQYRLDLSAVNADKLDRLINPYIAAAEKVGATRGRPKGSGGATRASSGSGRSKDELANIREWASKNGHEVSPRGRIAAPILDAYDKAHEPTRPNQD